MWSSQCGVCFLLSETVPFHLLKKSYSLTTPMHSQNIYLSVKGSKFCKERTSSLLFIRSRLCWETLRSIWWHCEGGHGCFSIPTHWLFREKILNGDRWSPKPRRQEVHMKESFLGGFSSPVLQACPLFLHGLARQSSLCPLCGCCSSGRSALLFISHTLKRLFPGSEGDKRNTFQRVKTRV